MFWKKKQVAAAKAEVPALPKAEKLPGPQEIQELVGRHLVWNDHVFYT